MGGSNRLGNRFAVNRLIFGHLNRQRIHIIVRLFSGRRTVGRRGAISKAIHLLFAAHQWCFEGH